MFFLTGRGIRSAAGVAVLLAMAMPLAAIAAAPGSPTTTPAPATQTAGQTLAAALAILTRATATPAERDAAVAQIMDLPSGPERLVAQLNTEIIREVPVYQNMLTAAAEKALRTRSKPADGATVAKMQAQVLSVSRGGHITKESIHETADPAMQELRRILLISPQEVLDTDPKLKARRDAIMALVQWRHDALEKVPANLREALATPINDATFPALFATTEELATLWATPMRPKDHQILQANAQLAPKLDAGEARGIFVLNRIRIIVGIGALAIDARLCAAARAHSQEMKDKGYFAHESPTPGLVLPWERARRAGTSANGECIAGGQGTGDGAIDAWWNSPGHHAIIMSAAPRIGLGRVEALWTLMTGG